jgi:hypothetical protein
MHINIMGPEEERGGYWPFTKPSLLGFFYYYVLVQYLGIFRGGGESQAASPLVKPPVVIVL